jgi:hypothetical protein
MPSYDDWLEAPYVAHHAYEDAVQDKAEELYAQLVFEMKVGKGEDADEYRKWLVEIEAEEDTDDLRWEWCDKQATEQLGGES